MTISVKHNFTSAKADGTDSTLIQPSNWNAEHTITLAAGKVLGRDTSGSGAVQELPLSIATTGEITAGTWNATAIGPTYGGTGQTSYTTGDLLYSSSTNVLAKLAAGTNGYVLTMAAGVPAWVAGGTGSVTSVAVSGGTSGLTTSGGPITTSGTITIAGTLSPANGGTGQTTYTDGQLLIGNTTGNTLTKATLTQGTGISITNGAGAITIAATGGGFTTMVLVTATGNFTVPAGVTKAKVTVVGAGGAGGGTGVSTAYRGGGGRSGGVAIKYITGLTPASTVSCTIGAAGVAASNATGGTGGTTSFGAYCSATGGAGGVGGNSLSTTATNTLVTGGVGSSGDLNLTGPKTVDFPYSAGFSNNCSGYTVSVFMNFGGQQGADGPLNLGYGGAAKNSGGAGNAATGYGAGGSGSFSTASSIAGGAGSPGVIIIEY